MQGHLKGERALHGFAMYGKLGASAEFVEDSCFQVSAIGATDGPLVSVSVSVPVEVFWAEKAPEQQWLEENKYDEESMIICDKSVGKYPKHLVSFLARQYLRQFFSFTSSILPTFRKKFPFGDDFS